MPGGGSSQVSSQSTSSGPWKVAQPFIKNAMGQASNLLENNKGFKAYPGGSYVGMSDPTQSALNSMQGIASQGNPFYQGAANFEGGLLNGNFNLDQSGYKALQGQGPNTESDYRNMLGNQNADFNNVVQNAANDMGDQIQRQFGGASYGSAANADYLTKGVGDLVSKMRSDNYFNNQNLQRGLLNDITGVQQMGFNNQRGLLGDMSNLSQMDIQNRMAGLGMADSVYNSQYLPSQMMAQVGAAYDQDAAAKRQSQMDTYNINQQAPWNRLAQAFGIFSGSGAQGNTVQSSVSQPTDIWSKLLGGGLLASQAF